MINVTENVDYTYSGPFNVTVPAGETRVVFNISITSDNKNEGTENFTVMISSANLHPNVSIGSVNNAIVSIVDDIGKFHIQYVINIKFLFSCDKFCSVSVQNQ